MDSNNQGGPIFRDKTLAVRLSALAPDTSTLSHLRKRLDKIYDMRSKMPLAKVSSSTVWLNTKDDQKWSFDKEFKGKFVVVDFWSSCCINCIHVLAEMDRLEKKFKDIPEVAFLGCHSAKFESEKQLHMLRQATIRYEIEHPVINDNEF